MTFSKLLRLSIAAVLIFLLSQPTVRAGKDESNLSAEEKALVDALLFNLIRQRQQQPPPPPPPPKKGDPEEAAPPPSAPPGSSGGPGGGNTPVG